MLLIRKAFKIIIYLGLQKLVYCNSLLLCLLRMIYPQKKDGTPMINPCGKYMVKLKFNGVARKVCLMFVYKGCRIENLNTQSVFIA